MAVSYASWSLVQLLKAVLDQCRRRHPKMWLPQVRDMVWAERERRMLTVGIVVGRIVDLSGRILGLDLISGTLGALR